MDTPLRVLIVEDSAADAELLLHTLHEDGYEPRYKRVETAEALAAALDREPWDVILSDHRLRCFDALSALKIVLTRQLDIPFIIVSDAIGDTLAIAAHRGGAQGYVLKSNLQWLGAVVERELRDAEERRARRQAETALRESEEMYRTLFETAGDAIFVADAATGVILDANQRAVSLIGRPLATLIGMHQIELHPPGKRAEYAALFELHALGPSTRPIEVWVRHTDGHDIPVEITTTLTMFGGRRAILGIFRDITERRQAQAGLQENEERYRRLVEAAPVAIVVHQDGRFVFVNQAAVQLLGATGPEELIGRPILEVVHPDYRASVQQRVAAATEHQKYASLIEEKYLRLDGTVVDVEVTAIPFTFQGRPAVQAVTRDISERKQGEQQTLLQRDLALGLAGADSLDAALRLCLDAALTISGFDAGGVYLLNPATGDFDLAVAQGISPRSAAAAAYISQTSAGWRQLMTGQPIYGAPSQVNGICPAANDETDTRGCGAVPILHQGQVIGSFNILSHTFDLLPDTSRHLLEMIVAQVSNAIAHLQAEQEIRQRTAQLSALNRLGAVLASTLDLARVYHIAYEHLSKLVDTDGFAISLYDPTARLLRVSLVISDGEVLDVTPFPPLPVPTDAIQGRARAIITQTPEIVVDQRAAAAAARGEKAVAVGRQTLSAAYVPMVVNGQVTGLLETQSVRLNAYGPAEVSLLGPAANQIGLAIENARLYEAMQRELGERTRAEESLKETLVELHRSNTDLEQFAHVASHDLQEPLRMVGSFVQLLGERYKGQLDADADDFIAFAVEGAMRMQQLINDLLDYSRINRFGRPFALTEVEAVFARVLRNMEFVIEDAGAIITHDPLPAVTADAIQLTQVFQSLIDNAIKFHGVEPPRLHVSVRETFEISETAKVWEFAIRDNGIGIDPKYQDRIFGVFQRLHTRDKYSGNGIGLAICKKVIERHGGRIWCESRLDQGATFYFTIPTRE